MLYTVIPPVKKGFGESVIPAVVKWTESIGGLRTFIHTLMNGDFDFICSVWIVSRTASVNGDSPSPIMSNSQPNAT